MFKSKNTGDLTKDDKHKIEDKEGIKSETGDFELDKRQLQKEKDIFECLKSEDCLSYKAKLIDCHAQVDRNIVSADAACNTELLKMVQCIHQCIEKKQKDPDD
ncbi:hypothetical protein JTE90_009377 [Oedothorax gibbosus]|uniref:Ubiquinol-cytochrome C reductase hinge domain-containing protein n=1 Tax=Oedothorax gibbosus TaxID=931172 RepID=A0AAV6VTZ9_9ARAC|nr:hypothetical protein JTE90_009377 [Oedothorax gibbosus]